MQVGMIGLGRMGRNMIRRLLRGGREAVAFDLDPNRVATAPRAWGPPAPPKRTAVDREPFPLLRPKQVRSADSLSHGSSEADQNVSGGS